MTNDEEFKRTSLNRRRMVKGLGAAGMIGLAGCAGGGSDSTPTDTPGDGNDGGNTNDTPTPTPKQGGKLNFAQVKSPLEFDPIVLNDVPSSEVADRIFEGLFAYDEGTGVVPQLATAMPEVSKKASDAAAATRYTVSLNPDATFQNGDSVTPEDVKYSFEAPVAEETENASELNMIEAITPVGEQTVQFDLKYPYGPFMQTLTWSIVPKAVREKDKQAFNMKNPVGSGQFTFDSWQEGQYVRLVRWDDYWGEPKANLQEAEFVPIEEATTRVTTLQNGENHIVKEIPPKLYPTVKSIQNAHIDEVPGIAYFYLAFNCNEGPTADKRVREAVDYCFSMDQAVQNYVEPTGVRQYSPLPKSMAQTWDMPLDEWAKIPHQKNIAEAKRLFDEAGVPKNYAWNIIVPPDDKREQIGISVSNGLKEAGFKNVSVQRLDWGAFLEKYVTGDEEDYNMYTLGWSGTPDPDAFTYYLFGRTEDTLGVTNGCFYGNNSKRGKKAAQMILDARKSADRAKRQQLYQDGIQMILEDRAHLPAYNLKNSFGVRDVVKDFMAHPVDSFHLVTDHNNVSLDE